MNLPRAMHGLTTPGTRPDERRSDADRSPPGRRRRRMLDEVFGDVLPDVTRDESTTGGRAGRAATDDRWYRDNRPPHHG